LIGSGSGLLRSSRDDQRARSRHLSEGNVSLEEISLKAAFRGKFRLGAAVGGVLPDSLDPGERQLLARHFDALTPENCMKPGPVHPVRGRPDFVAGDALIRFADAHRMSVVGHCLSWHQQCPDWLLSAGTTREAGLEQLREHIHTVAGHYRGRLQGWDVVNEAVADNGEFLRDTPALRAIGPDYIVRAFEFAREADPKAELYYNDYNIEQPAKRQRTLRLLEQLLAAGVRVDGVGIQGHYILDQVPFDDVRAALASYRALGLGVMITELDIDVVDRPDCSADIAVQRAYAPGEDLYRDGCPEAIARRQAEQYARLFEIFAEPGHTPSRVTFWGLHDGRSWLNSWPGKRTNHPLLFDRACRPNAGYAAVLDVALRGASA
jgi:endo-1,4-beta-xylanase